MPTVSKPLGKAMPDHWKDNNKQHIKDLILSNKTDKDILAALYTCFENCKVHKTNNSGGSMRGEKGVGLELFYKDTIKNLIPENMHVETHHTITLSDGLSFNADIVIFIDNVISWYIESKDYMDIDMYKRFAFDAFILSTEYPNMKFLSLSMQKSSKDASRVSINDRLKLSDKIYHLEFFPTSRVSKNNLYLLDYAFIDALNYYNSFVLAINYILMA